MPFGFGKPKILVTVIDADNGTLILKSEQEVDQLPVIFDEGTTIHLGDKEFDIVEANPSEREAYAKTQKLTLKVRLSDQYIDAAKVLYTLPTICDVIPPAVKGTRTGQRILELHEDDWRQVELVSKVLSERVDCELEQIDEIYRQKRVPEGYFRALHVRKDLPQPLADSNISVDRLRSCLSVKTDFDGITYSKASGLIEGGFAFEGRGGLCIYGLEKAAVVSIIGIFPGAIEEPSQAAESLALLLDKYKLILVDWCRISFVQSELQLTRYFESAGGGV